MSGERLYNPDRDEWFAVRLYATRVGISTDTLLSSADYLANYKQWHSLEKSDIESCTLALIQKLDSLEYAIKKLPVSR